MELRKKNVKKRVSVFVFPAPALDPKSKLSLIYERLGNIQTMKVEFAVLPSAAQYDYRSWMGKLLVEEFKLVREAAILEGEIEKMTDIIGSSVPVVEFSSRSQR